MIVLDASVLIAHLDGTDAHHGRARNLLLDAAAEELAVSSVTLAEVLVAPARSGRLDQAALALQRLGVRSVPLPADSPVRLATLRAGTGLMMPDCCVLLTTEQVGAAALATFDEQLAAAGRDRGHVVLGA
ncbi:MAG: type II toxin-antitoxin system VapC family toxin [Actinomycetes bacterium]